MNKKEKKKLARKMLERHDYSEKEIKKILRHAFGDDKPERVDDAAQTD